MLHAQSGRVVDGRGLPVLMRCVSLSPWLIPEGYLAGLGSLAALETSPSQFKQRLAAIVGPEKAHAFWSAWEKQFVTAADFKRLHEEGFNRVRLPSRPPMRPPAAACVAVTTRSSATLRRWNFECEPIGCERHSLTETSFWLTGHSNLDIVRSRNDVCKVQPDPRA